MKKVNENVGLDQVLKHFVGAIELPEGENLFDYNYLYDPVKQIFAFTFYVEEAMEPVKPLKERLGEEDEQDKEGS